MGRDFQVHDRRGKVLIVQGYVTFAWVTLPFASLLHFTGLNFASLSMLAAAMVGFVHVTHALMSGRIKRTAFGVLVVFGALIFFGAIPIVWEPQIRYGEYSKGVLTQLVSLFGLLGYVTTLTMYPNAARKGLLWGIYLFTAVAFVEVAAMSLAAGQVKVALNMILSGQTSSRVIATGFEPSVASRIAIFNFGALLFVTTARPPAVRVLLLTASLLVFAFSFSIIGFMVPVVFLILLVVVRIRSFFSGKLLAIVLIAVIAVGWMVALSWDTIGATHAGRRIIMASRMPMSEWVYIDGSTALRVLNQVVAARIFVDIPFGIGAGQFSNYFADYGGSLLRPVANLGEVRKTFELESANPQSIFMRLIVEGGAFPLAVLVGIAAFVLSYLRRFSIGEHFFLSFIIVSASQTASFGFAQIWVAMAFLLTKVVRDNHLAK